MDRLIPYNSTKQELRPYISAHNRLLNNPDFILYTERLEMSLKQMRKVGDRLTGDALAWNQGACQLLQELIDDNSRVNRIVRGD